MTAKFIDINSSHNVPTEDAHRSSLMVRPNALQVLGALEHGRLIRPANEDSTFALIAWADKQIESPPNGRNASVLDQCKDTMGDALDLIERLAPDESAHMHTKARLASAIVRLGLVQNTLTAKGERAVKQRRFTITWEIDVWAESHEAAARAALEIQRDPTSSATVFEVWEEDATEGHRIDITEMDKWNES